ncbi:nuclease domain-containing protein [Pseudomonas aeruginosa]|nr:nuclease domain-containing protein [Pseudomonas aeruginosa]MDU0572626.1 nuclease domain-containing protein [Pseudomonas aeruginosa]MDU0653174.1 nuclease domain-containing protein [Pseudomonas aeruginosa]
MRQRSQSGANSKRVPDIVIQIKNPQGKVRLIILDAKYSYANKAFIDYLPDLTMKYVHGIHRFGQNEPLVSSMSILYPDDKAGFRGFHYGPLGVFGEAPVSPSLQACGIVLGNDRQLDQLDRLIRRTLELEGVSPQGLQLIETERDVA